jgi:Calcineurin-like phosphoesterase
MKSLENTMVIIGDIHGRTLWKNIARQHPGDEIVFVGDYFDTKDDIPASEQIKNFREILALKKSNPGRFTLLLGNHDFHYLPQAGEHYSGYQHLFADEIFRALKPALDERLISICIQNGKYLVSHAGLTRTWCRSQNIPLRNPVEAVNLLFYQKPEAFRFLPGWQCEPTGDEPEQGPLWVRPDSLKKDYLRGFIHVAGHTQHPDIAFDRHTIFVDVLGFSPKYLKINAKQLAMAKKIDGI